MAAVTVNNIVSEIALTHFLFAGLTITVAVNIIGPGAQARYGALEILSFTDDPTLQGAALEQYDAGNRLIAVGTQLIQVNKSITELAKVIQTVGGITINIAKAYINKEGQALGLAAIIQRLQMELKAVNGRFNELDMVLEGQTYIDVKSKSSAIEKSQTEIEKLIRKILERVKA
jgi:hypothetical protein